MKTVRHTQIALLLLIHALFLLRVEAQTPPKSVPPPAQSKAKDAASDDVLTRALKLKKAGQTTQAIALLEKEITRRYRNPRAHYLLGWLYRQQSETKPSKAKPAAPVSNSDEEDDNEALSPKELAAISFRAALNQGLNGRDGEEARAALARMGEPYRPPTRQPYTPRPMTGTQQIESNLMMREFIAQISRPTLAQWLPAAALRTLGCLVAWLLIAGLMCGATRSRFGRGDWLMIGVACLLFIGIQIADFATTAVRWTLALGAGFVVSSALFLLVTLGIWVRRLVTQKGIDKTGIISWGLASSMVMLFLMGTVVRPFATPSWAAIAACAVLWTLVNPWFIVSQRAEKFKKQGQYEQAVGVLEKWAHKAHLSDKTRFVVLNDLSSNHALAGHTDKSMDAARNALRYANAFPAARVFPHANLADNYITQGDYPLALEHCAAIFAQARHGSCFGGNPLWLGAAHSMLANLNALRGWWDEAEMQADLGLQQLPPEIRNNPMAKNRACLCKSVKAAARLEQGQLENALKFARQAVRPKPQFATGAYCHSILGAVLLAHHQLAEAEIECRHALTLMAQSPAAHYWLARVLQAQSRNDEAARHWTDVLAIAPQSSFAAWSQTALQDLPNQNTSQLVY